MELYFGENGDQRIRGDFIRRAVLRSDLVPIPLTLEAEIRVGTETAAEFDVGRSITTYDGDELEIIKSEHVQQARMQGDDLSGYVRLIATLKPVTPVAFIKPRAVIKHGASLTEVYRACGATLRGIEGDFPVPRFVCLAGEAHTYHIARALQEAGGVVRWRNGRLAFIPLGSLFNQEPVDTIVDAASDDVESGFLERHDIPWFYSLDANGEFVYGNRGKPRAARFQPGANAMTLRNMTGCLVLAKTTRLKYTQKVAAGDLIEVVGGEPLVAMTVANLFIPGADGEEPEQFTRVWLGRWER
ncbi:hypothetical protein [Halomonas sp. OfavH-34-E]|uniref:hypothetical protein n=1 Tax=Halomonas sp. OfavH-34-E TaxID=2954491 RepID=UPI0020981958|nr:hypothetical protein [Halomonas sp. OfavH-34-E]MCO7216888.1 hypothetical protein [Halomonas sp. OfavH-34-E]